MRTLWHRIRFWGRVFVNAVTIWNQSDAFVYAAAVAFFTIFSIAPVVIIAVTLVGFALGEQAVEGRLMEELEETMGPEAAYTIEVAVANTHLQLAQAGIWPTLISIGVIVVGATTVFAYLQRSLNAIWDVVPKPTRTGILPFVWSRLISLLIVLAIGLVLAISLLVSVAVQSVLAFAAGVLPIPGILLASVEVALSLAILTLLFGTLFQILPDVILDFRDVLIGAAITAALFTVGRLLIAWYLAQTATATTYGAAGSLVVLLLWVNYSSLILLFGAAFTRAQREARGKSVIPRKPAVIVQHEVIERER